ncbi:MAG: NAD-dependent DNA ligase LigA [Candidatus Kariarchaeaceae archaeon]|jgi:DNA ligase (NAD+)
MAKRDPIQDLAAEILRHKRLYYNGTPEISDFEYDLLEEKLQNLDPDHPVFFLVGTLEGGKVRHDPPMLSCAKATNIDEVMKWIEKIDHRGVSVGYKVDGLSLSLVYENKKFIQASTRGNGQYGDDETLGVMKIDNIPKTIPVSGRINIRGELFMKISNFLDVNRSLQPEDQYSSPRNLAAGTIKQKDLRILDKRTLHFKAFELLGFDLDKSIEEITSNLREWGFDVADIAFISHPTREIITKTFDEFEQTRNDLDFEIDGVIFKYNQFDDRAQAGMTEHHPKWQIAWKFQSKGETTKIVDIIWQVGRTGVLTPVAEVDPIEVAGATISRATVHNAEFMEAMNLAIGDIVEIERAGDVIPKIINIISKGPSFVSLPNVCPSCKTVVNKEGVNLVCISPICRDRDIQSIIYWVRITEIDGLGQKSIEKLYDYPLVTHFSDLYSEELSESKLRQLLGKNGVKIFNNINQSRNLPFDRFLAGLGISTLGKKMGKVLANHYETFESLQNTTIDILMSIEGISEITATNILEGVNNPNLAQRLFDNGVFIQYQKSQGSKQITPPVGVDLDTFFGDGEEIIQPVVEIQKFQGKRVYVTGKVEGYSKKKLQQLLEEKGFEWSTSISSKLDFLIFGEKPGKSKIDKAMQLGITIKSWSEFLDFLNGAK